MRIGVDLGGTKIEAVVLAEDGEILDRRRKPTPREDYQAILDVVGSLVRGLEADFGETATVGVAAPGSVSPGTNLIRYSNTLVMNGQPFVRMCMDCIRAFCSEGEGGCHPGGGGGGAGAFDQRNRGREVSGIAGGDVVSR